MKIILTLTSLLLLFPVFSARGDQRMEPIVAYCDDEDCSKADVQRILAQYRGPQLTCLKEQIIIEFTVYPDGSCRWLRLAKIGNSPVSREIGTELVKSLQNSLPLNFVSVVRLKNPEPAALCVSPGVPRNKISLGISDSIGDVVYYFSRNSPYTYEPWLKSNLRTLNTQLRIQGQTRASVACLWLRLNPDGTIESTVFPRTNITTSKQLSKALLTASRSATWQYGPDSVIFQGVEKAPVGILIIYDSALSPPLRLRLTSFRLPPRVEMIP